eukprot:m.21341 g.21341  ORF g.21341 m.21341 type:complete len:474 (+) comp7116_c0_seq1:153-1574(+)
MEIGESDGFIVTAHEDTYNEQGSILNDSKGDETTLDGFVMVHSDEDEANAADTAEKGIVEPNDAEEEAATAQVKESRGPPLTEEAWKAFFDKDGRLLNESGFKKTVFRGGIEPDVRKVAWPFLMGYFDFQSTYREREIIQTEHRIAYAAMKERWREELGMEEDDSEHLPDPEHEHDDQYEFMFIQAKVTAMRTAIDENAARASIKTIEKDVPRTDRKGNYFSDDQPHRLKWLNDILVTYAVYQPQVGYAQGMNDVLSMILAVMDHEADAYWCFRNYLETIQADFMAKGMMEKLESLRELLAFMDPDILEHFQKIDAGDMVFCHRWLLLTFKREFSFEDAVRLFEILCSHHLELSSIEAEKARNEEIRVERERDLGAQSAGWQAVERGTPNNKYTFELFVCIAILRMYRKDLLKTGDVADIFTFINGLVMKMDLDTVLCMTEKAFFDYCRLSVTKADTESYLLLSKSVADMGPK